MIGPSSMMLQSELAQARRQIQMLALDREQYVRLTVCLANLIRNNVATAKIVSGQVAVSIADFEAVPSKWQVGLEKMNVRAEDAPEDDKGEEVLVVKVEPKGPAANGKSLVAPSPPKIVMP